jgi:regulatory protein
LKSDAYAAALRLLARREHGAQELAGKLSQRGYSSEAIESALGECQRLGLQSDARYIEVYCRQRMADGFGPLRLLQELKQRQISAEDVVVILDSLDIDWLSAATHAWMKKYKKVQDTSYMALQKQKQFLRYRGFSMETIAMVFEKVLHEDLRDKTSIY